MTVNEIFEMKRQGLTDAAYEAARRLYATDRGRAASVAMFWTAVDAFRLRMREGRVSEARRMFLALQRLSVRLPDEEGRIADTLKRCGELLTDGSPAATPSLAPHALLGQWGEEVAARYLRERGYEIVERDWHSGHRDIDIVARRGRLYVFVEVKTRRNHDFNDPIDAIGRVKLLNLCRAISHYVCSHGIDCHRFDVITVVGPQGCPTPEITHLEDISVTELQRPR